MLFYGLCSLSINRLDILIVTKLFQTIQVPILTKPISIGKLFLKQHYVAEFDIITVWKMIHEEMYFDTDTLLKYTDLSLRLVFP